MAVYYYFLIDGKAKINKLKKQKFLMFSKTFGVSLGFAIYKFICLFSAKLNFMSEISFYPLIRWSNNKHGQSRVLGRCYILIRDWIYCVAIE